MLKKITIIKQNIQHNIKHPEDMKAPIRVEEGKEVIRGIAVAIMGPSVLIYEPEKPLKCGARVWIETRAEVWLDEGNGYIHRFLDERE